MDQLIQKSLFGTKKIKIYESKFSYTVSVRGNETEIMVPFENLSADRVSFKKADIGFAVASIFMYGIAGTALSSVLENEKENAGMPLTIVFFIVATALMGIWIFHRQNSWKINLLNYSTVMIHKNIPDAVTVEEFYEQLIDSRNSYLKANYAVIDATLNHENYLKNLKWLKSINVLSKAEYESKLSELNEIQNTFSKINFN